MTKIKTPGGDSVQDLLRPREHPLDVFFQPESVALIGATENPGSVGRTVLWNLLSTPFGGTVYPVNPKRSSILGIRAYPNVGAIPEKVDLAVITTPAKIVPGVIRECAQAGVQAAIVEVLVAKTIRAAKRIGVGCVTASGGVTCNRALRQELAAVLAVVGEVEAGHERGHRTRHRPEREHEADDRYHDAGRRAVVQALEAAVQELLGL